MIEKKFTAQSSEVKQLLHQDPLLKPLIEAVPLCPVVLWDDAFAFLVFTVCGQQVSATVAELLYQRIQERCEHHLQPQRLSQLGHAALKSLGLTEAKTATLLRLAHAAQDGYLDARHFQHSYHATLKHLTQLKGIGPWTVEMFVMFVLQDWDCFSVRDLGLVRAYQALVNPDATPQDIEAHSLMWRPYRSIVAHYLWYYWDVVKKTKS
jgi:DNA-3-methyladenine glycosylase II